MQGWSPSTIRAILTREVYNGVIVWNKSRKRPLTWGQINQLPRPESEWLRTPAEHLRLVRLNGTCANVLRISVVEVNEAVLQAIEEHALTAADQRAKLAWEGKDVDKRIARLVAAIEMGSEAPSD